MTRSHLGLELPHPGRPTGGTVSCVTSPQARFMVCGHWPGAQLQAFPQKMEREVALQRLPEKSDSSKQVSSVSSREGRAVTTWPAGACQPPSHTPNSSAQQLWSPSRSAIPQNWKIWCTVIFYLPDPGPAGPRSLMVQPLNLPIALSTSGAPVLSTSTWNRLWRELSCCTKSWVK